MTVSDGKFVALLGPVPPASLPFVEALAASEAKWFSSDPPPQWSAAGPDEWSYVVLSRGVPVGFARLVRASASREPGLATVMVAHYAVSEPFRRRGIAAFVLAQLEAIAHRQGCGLIACVLAHNEPSVALCRRYFGGELYRGEDDGGEVVVFGNGRAATEIEAFWAD